MVRLSDIPLTEITVQDPPGPPNAWSDLELITFIDEVDSAMKTVDEHSFVTFNFKYLAAWIELHKRTEA